MTLDFWSFEGFGANDQASELLLAHGEGPALLGRCLRGVSRYLRLHHCQKPNWLKSGLMLHLK